MTRFSSVLGYLALTFPVLGDHFYAHITTTRVGDMFLEMLVAPDGEVDDCEVLLSDFFAADDARICNQLRQNSVAAPGIDQNGQPIHATSIYRFSTTILPGSNSREIDQVILRREPEIEIGVNALPSGIEGEFVLGLRVVVDETGRIEFCEPSTRPADAYSEFACAELARYDHRVRHDRDEGAVRYLTDMNVAFVTTGS